MNPLGRAMRFGRRLVLPLFAGAMLYAYAQGEPLLMQARDNQLNRNYSMAIRLYSRILAADPESAAALLGRGQSLLALGNTSRAVADFGRLSRRRPGDDYARIWLFLAEARNGTRRPEILAAADTGSRAGGWPRPIVRYLAGMTDWEPMFETTEAAPGAQKAREICEAELFYGENVWAMGHGRLAMGAFAVARGRRCRAEPVLMALAESEYRTLFREGYRPYPRD